MTSILKFLGYASIIGGIILGVILGLGYSDGFRFAAALSWWLGGAISGIVFLALAYILEYVEAIYEYIRESSQTSKATYPETGKSSYPETGKPKQTLDSAQGYKMKSID